jgi:CRISPR-associated endonuclease Csn1
MEQFDWKADKAFKEPIYKPSKDTTKANIIKKVKIIDGPANTYVKVHKGKGFADNGAMIRVDVFKHKNKYYSVPVYASWIGRKDLPTQYTPLKDNKHIDESFEFLFSIYPKTLLEFVTKEGLKIIGYYIRMNSSTQGNYNYYLHDSSGNENIKQIGVVTLKSFSKLYVDELGFIHRVGKEKRKPLNVN